MPLCANIVQKWSYFKVKLNGLIVSPHRLTYYMCCCLLLCVSSDFSHTVKYIMWPLIVIFLQYTVYQHVTNTVFTNSIIAPFRISPLLLWLCLFAVILHHHLRSAASVKGLRVQQWIPSVLLESLGVRPAVNFHAAELWLAETLSLTPSLMVHRAHQPCWSISVLSFSALSPSFFNLYHS